MKRIPRAARAFVALVTLASGAFAEASASDVALAEALFQEGQKLLKERRYAEACPKFQESQRLDPGGGTLFQLATCHEFTGRTASAWAEFSEVALLAKQRNRADIERAARERVRALEPRLSWLTIAVPEAARLEGLSVERDGTTLGAASFGTAMPADPGKHTVAATAPGRRAWSTTVEVGPESDRKIVTVPELEALPERPTAPAAASWGAVRSETLPPPRARHSPALFYAAAGVGIAGLGTAAFFGIRSYRKEQDANEKCPTTECPDPSAVADSKSAVSSANIANVAGAFGLAGAGVFTYLLLTNSPREHERRATLRVSPRAGPGAVAVGVDGRF